MFPIGEGKHLRNDVARQPQMPVHVVVIPQSNTHARKVAENAPIA